MKPYNEADFIFFMELVFQYCLDLESSGVCGVLVLNE